MHAPPDVPFCEQTENDRHAQVGVPEQAVGTSAQKGAGCGGVGPQLRHTGWTQICPLAQLTLPQAPVPPSAPAQAPA